MINIQHIDDNEWFNWCLVRYLNPAVHHPAIIAKLDNNFARTVYFKNIKFLVNSRDNHKTENKNFISISLCGYENKEKYKHGDFLLIEEEEKSTKYIK